MADTQEQSATKIPNVLWAQRTDIVYLTINLEDCKSPAIELDEKKLVFKGKGGTNKDSYEITLDFHGEVNPQESKYVVRDRDIQFVIRKKESAFWPRLLKEIRKAFWLKTDFNKWKDEDDSEDETDQNMDLAEMMQSMGGMGGGGPGGPGMQMPEGDEEDSDDEELPGLE